MPLLKLLPWILVAGNRPSPCFPPFRVVRKGEHGCEGSGERRGVCYFSRCCDKLPEESELRMGRLLWAHTSRGHMATVQETTDFHSESRERETMNLDVSLPFSLLFRPGPYACGNKLATFKLRLHASVNPSHKLCQRFVS